MFDYELIDSGNFRRLERFGKIILDRSAPQANWNKLLKDEWLKADAYFNIDDKSHKFWEIKNKKIFKDLLSNTDTEYSWLIKIDELTVELNLGENGQIGIFPEQYENWEWIKDTVSSFKEIKLLNGFSYTGIASAMALLNKNIDITNVDASKSVKKRFYRNLELSKLTQSDTMQLGKSNSNNILSNQENLINIKFFTDDILTFLNREFKRNKKYDAFILDPPAFGRFKNKTWSMLKDLPNLIDFIDKLLSSDFKFIVFSLHDERIDKKMLSNYFSKFFDKHILESKNKMQFQILNLTIKSNNGNDLPSGLCVRIARK